MNVFLRLNQIPMLENVETVNMMKSELEAFEEDFNLMNGTEETHDAEEKLDNLFEIGYEVIALSTRKLNDEAIKSYEIFEKITQAQEVYLSYSELFDNRKTPMSGETIEKVIQITEEVLEKYGGDE